MPINNLLPWNRSSNKLTVRRDNDPENELLRMQSQMNRLFDEFFDNPFGLSPFRALNVEAGNFVPMVDVSETDDEYKVVAEIPGMTEKDVDVSFSEDTLIISGHKDTEKEEKDRRYHRIERSSGSFRREIPFMGLVNEEKIEAEFKNGVLTISLPKKTPDAGKVKKITVQAR